MFRLERFWITPETILNRLRMFRVYRKCNCMKSLLEKTTVYISWVCAGFCDEEAQAYVKKTLLTVCLTACARRLKSKATILSHFGILSMNLVVEKYYHDRRAVMVLQDSEAALAPIFQVANNIIRFICSYFKLPKFNTQWSHFEHV